MRTYADQRGQMRADGLFGAPRSNCEAAFAILYFPSSILVFLSRRPPFLESGHNRK
jgi:hypothetical protein